MPRTRRDYVYFILGGFFLTNAILGELTGGKLFEIPATWLSFIGLSSVVLSIGVIPWPVVFITTDLINEYFGKPGVRRLTFLAVGLIAYAFLLLYFEMKVPTWEKSPTSGAAFNSVFGQSQRIIVGSLTAFLVAQLVDVMVFQHFKKVTGGRLLWLRATGSTVISQMFDTFLVGYIAFVMPLPGSPPTLAMNDFLRLALGSYLFKLIVAIGITPIIYAAHAIIDNYLAGDPEPGQA